MDCTLLCRSIVKEEPNDFIDCVTIGSQDDAKSHNNYEDQYHITAKEEPVQLTSEHNAIIGAEMQFTDSEFHCPGLDNHDLDTILKIEEMDMSYFKNDEQFHKKGIVVKQPAKTRRLQHLRHRQEGRQRTRKILKPGTMMKIAKNYADLFSDEVCHPSPYPRFTDSTVIQCPACTIPRDQSSHSAFLELLLHVRQSHSDCSDVVFYKIAWIYASLIQCLKIKIFRKLKIRHSERLKNVRKHKPVRERKNVC